MQPMVTAQRDPKLEFPDRLRKALDEAGFPPEGEGRQKRVAKLGGVSQQAAGKWLRGETLPELPRLIDIAFETGFAVEWLLTGRGPERVLRGADVVMMNATGELTLVEFKQAQDSDSAAKAFATGQPANAYQVIRRDPDLIRELVAGVLAPVGLHMTHMNLDAEDGLELQAKWSDPGSHRRGLEAIAGDPQPIGGQLPGELKRPPRLIRKKRAS